jgi:hypothetical protein
MTTTAAPSVMGTPAAPPMISLAEAAANAQKQMHNQPTASASQAAKKLEESRARPVELTGAQSSAVSAVGHHDAARAKAPTPVTRPAISTASAAAAAFEANMIGKRKKAQPSPNATPSGSQQPKGTTWTDSKPFRPNAKEPAAIEVDYSWTRTGGNAWSNKYRLDLPKTAQGAVNGWSQPQQHVHQQQAHKHHQAQHPHQTQRQQQQPQPQHHQRHYSVPVHPTHQAQPRKAQPQQNTSAAWRGWGREGVDEMEGTYTESDEETTNGWNFQQGGDGWGQSPGGWAQQPAGKHNKAHGQHRKSEDHRDQGNGWGQHQQHPVKDHWAQKNDGRGQDQWGQGGGGGGGDGWGKEGGDEWGQGGGGDGWGQGGGGGGDGWGQGGGGGGGDGWGQGGGGGGDGWGQGGGGKGAVDGWGKEGGGKGAADGWGKEGGGRGAADGWGKEGGGRGAADGWGKGAADGWGEGGGDGWGQQAQGGKTGWGNTSQHGWGSQAEGAGRASLNNEWGGTTQAKVKFTAAEAAGSRNVVSPQQRSQILNSLLNNQPQTQKNHAAQLSAAAHAAQIAAAAKYQAQGHQGHQGHHQERREAWEAEESSDGWGSDEDEEGEHNRRVHFSPKFSEVWGGSPRSIPTKALAHAHAQQGIKTTLINDASNVRFAESKGAAFAHVANAFFGNARLARERIHWLFPPNKDKRVAEMLAWVQKMSFNLGTYGVRYPYLLTSHLDTYN